MQKQLDAGLDEINDGEMGRSHYATSALQRLSGLDGSLQGISERWSPPVLPWDGWMTIGGWALMGMIHLHSWHSNFWGQGPWGLAKNLLLGRFAAPIDVTWDQLSQGLTLTEKTEVSAASCSGFLADISWEIFLWCLMNFVLYPHWKEQLQHGLNGGSKMLFKVGSHLYCGTPTVHDAAGSEVQTRINMHKQKPIICIIYVKSKLLKQWLTGEHTPTSDPPILILSSNIWYAYIYIHHTYIYIYCTLYIHMHYI